MMHLPRRFLRWTARAATVPALFALTFNGFPASPQTVATIKIVVPAPAGGALDMMTRLLAEQVGRMHGRTLVIENRPGAGTVIGTEAVSRATPDGNTLLTNAPPAFVITPHLHKVNYDPLTSFEPVCNLVTFPLVIAVNGKSPYHTLSDLLAAARTKPGELTLGSVGPATLAHVAFEMLKRAAKVDMTFIPFPGTAPAVNALLGDHVTSFMGNYSDVSSQLNAGTLRVLATASRNRIESLPQVPTVSESGYSDYKFDGWFGLFAPGKTPNATVIQLGDWFATAMQVTELRTRLAGQALHPAGICGAEFAALIRSQHDDYGRIIREAKMKMQ
jgi:tripartite-type tricarboxylate transporter receptor subunit TctC